MRGRKQDQVSVACLLNVETMIPKDHPIRAIKSILGVVLREMDGAIRGGRAVVVNSKQFLDANLSKGVGVRQSARPSN